MEREIRINWDKFYRNIFYMCIIFIAFIFATTFNDDHKLLVGFILLFGLIISYIEK